MGVRPRAGACLVTALLAGGCSGERAPPAPEAPPEPEAPADFVREAVWSPDGRRLAVSWYRRDRYRVYGLFGPYEGVPPAPSRGIPLADGEGVWASWSPDGLWLAFGTERDGNGEVYRIRPDGMGAENLTRNPAADSEPAYAPDGRRIAFVSDRDGSGRRIWVMGADGSEPRLLGGGLPGSEQSGPAWSPDGRSVAYHATEGGRDFVYVAAADGGGATRVAPGVFPAWATRGAALYYDRADSVFLRPVAPGAEERFVVTGSAVRPSPDGRWLAVVRGNWPTSSLYLVDLESGSETRITP